MLSYTIFFTLLSVCILIVIAIAVFVVARQKRAAQNDAENLRKDIERTAAILRHERDFARKVLVSTKNAILITDENDKIIFINPIACKYANAEIADFLGKHSDEFYSKFTDERGNPAKNLSVKIAESGRTITDLTGRVGCPDGHTEIFSIFVCPVAADTPTKNGAIFMATRITEAVRIREELTNTNAILRRIFQEASCGISIKDVDKGCRYLFWNKEMEMLTGKTEKEMIGKTYRECFSTPESDNIEKEDLKIESYTDGQTRYFSQKKSLIELPDGDKMILTICADCTEILNSEREKKEILESMREGVVLFENTRRILYANKAARDIARIDESVLGNAYCDGVFCKESHMHNCPTVRTVVTGQRNSVIKKINGKLYNVVSSAIKDDSGKVKKALMILTDITKEGQAKETLSEALKKANAAATAKSAFLSTMSHEIRTPLNVIIGSSELLNLEKLSPSAEDSVKAIYVASSALSQIINNVLDYSKLDAGRMEIILRSTRVQSIISDMRRLFQQKADDKKLQLICSCQEIPSLMLDNQHLRQILMNLISNAIKFTDAGFVKISAIFKNTDENKGELTMSVSDSGRGIERQNIRTLFQPFEREITHNSKRIEGTGLGLSISLLLATLMGGKLDISSQVGSGSTFTLTIPDLEIVHGKDKIVQDLETGIADFSGTRVLVVDDIKMNRTVLSKILDKLNVRNKEASSVDEALSILRSEKFDAVITDLWMPEKSGAELAEEISKDEKLKNIPVVLLTADTEMKDNYNVDKFKGLILKPITIRNVSRVLLQVLK